MDKGRLPGGKSINQNNFRKGNKLKDKPNNKDEKTHNH